MNDAQKTENSWAWWETITGLAITVERSGESITLKPDLKLLRKLRPFGLSAMGRLIETYLKEYVLK